MGLPEQFREHADRRVVFVTGNGRNEGVAQHRDAPCVRRPLGRNIGAAETLAVEAQEHLAPGFIDEYLALEVRTVFLADHGVANADRRRDVREHAHTDLERDEQQCQRGQQEDEVLGKTGKPGAGLLVRAAG